jgi:hypothetical protein
MTSEDSRSAGEKESAAIHQLIEKAEQSARQKGSGITPSQLRLAVDHMLAAAAYLMTADERYAQGAVNIICLAGESIRPLNQDVGDSLEALGETIRHTGMGIVSRISESAGFPLSSEPESPQAYLHIGERNIPHDALMDRLRIWLVPPERKAVPPVMHRQVLPGSHIGQMIDAAMVGPAMRNADIGGARGFGRRRNPGRRRF